MNAPVKTPEERKADLQGMGDSRLRKEDATRSMFCLSVFSVV